VIVAGSPQSAGGPHTPRPSAIDVVRRETRLVLLIDAANVIGSRPDGWWRDRPGAARRFTDEVRAAVATGRLAPPVTVVVEGRFRLGVEEASADGVIVLHAVGEGDDAIAAIAESHSDVVAVTADRELAARMSAAQAEVVGPKWLLDRLIG
jgi:8-oxo-dGTP diphosphatase